jgi:hypothetical protein
MTRFESLMLHTLKALSAAGFLLITWEVLSLLDPTRLPR